MAASESVTFNTTTDDSPASPLYHIDPETLEIADNAFLCQIDRILRSDELHGSEVLRRLLKFLAHKSASGEADELKEYIVAIEGLGKPTTYDPRYNSAVRIQVGRLRRSWRNYYQREGQRDQVLIDLPKGRFKLTCEIRESLVDTPLQNSPAETRPATPAETPSALRLKRFAAAARATAWLIAGVLLAIAGERLVHRSQPAQAKAQAGSYPVGWDASVEELWKPFVTNNRPMIVAIDDPLFVELDVKKKHPLSGKKSQQLG